MAQIRSAVNVESNDVLIPRNINFVWIGEEMPDEDVGNIETFREKCPDWRIVLWAENPDLQRRSGPWHEIRPLPPCPVEHCIGPIRSMTESREHLAALSDVYRLCCLYELGGVYFDTDVVCLKDITSAMRGVRLGLSMEFDCHTTGNFFIASEPYSHYMLSCLNSIRTQIRNVMKTGGRMPVFTVTGPPVVARELNKPGIPLHLFPYEYFSPWSPMYILPESYLEKVPWPSCSYAIHLYGGRWKQKHEMWTRTKAETSNHISDAMRPHWS